MSPDDLHAVDRTWAELRSRQDDLVAHLEESFRRLEPVDVAAPRARWLVDAVVELVGLLGCPSHLERHARRLAATWPVAGTAPTFAVEGRAWMSACRDLCPSWTGRTELAWRHAWLLVADVVAEESLSPFAGPPSPGR